MPDQEYRLLILVVEDDALIRMHGVDVLEEAGFLVLEAANADEAAAILADHGDVRLMFSDIDMPGSMDGIDLARLVHDRWPAILLLLTSGNHHLDDAAVLDGKFLQKPWAPDMLIGKVSKMLDH